ncbi:hypothetical protein CF328_g6374, partial [Tilletia controversa]
MEIYSTEKEGEEGDDDTEPCTEGWRIVNEGPEAFAKAVRAYHEMINNTSYPDKAIHEFSTKAVECGLDIFLSTLNSSIRFLNARTSSRSFIKDCSTSSHSIFRADRADSTEMSSARREASSSDWAEARSRREATRACLASEEALAVFNRASSSEREDASVAMEPSSALASAPSAAWRALWVSMSFRSESAWTADRFALGPGGGDVGGRVEVTVSGEEMCWAEPASDLFR